MGRKYVPGTIPRKAVRTPGVTGTTSVAKYLPAGRSRAQRNTMPRAVRKTEIF